jgi:hypothetical protein
VRIGIEFYGFKGYGQGIELYARGAPWPWVDIGMALWNL